MARNWGVARFYGMGSMEYLLESGAWLADRKLFDGAPIRLFDSADDADAVAQTLSHSRQPHGVQFMIDKEGRIVTASSMKKPRPG